MIEYGPEISFEGMPVGLFKNGIAPLGDGAYAYEAYRGLGHYEMHKQLEAQGVARCQYVATDGATVSFSVVGQSKDGALQLEEFSVRAV